MRKLVKLELRDARDAPDGTDLHEYDIELSRYVRQREIAQIRIVTASPQDRLNDRWDEVWELAGDFLKPDEWTYDEDRHKEVILGQTKTTKRCPHTAEMKFTD